MPKMRTFLWKSPKWDGPVARMTYDPDKDDSMFILIWIIQII